MAETSDHIGRYGHVGYSLPNSVHQLQVGLSAMVPPHPHQHFSVTALCRQMYKIAYIWVLLDDFQHLQRKIFGVGRGEPESDVGVADGCGLEQIGKSGARIIS